MKNSAHGRGAASARRYVVLLVAGVASTVALVSTAGPAAPAIAKLDRAIAAARATHAKYPAEMVAKGQKTFDGSFTESVAFETADKRFKVQLWESGPGVLHTDGYPHDEFCLVLEGQLEVTNRDGRTESFQPGDSFVIPKGWAGTWSMKTKFRKQYIALTPAGS